MHFELRFDESRAFILNLEFTAITYFILGLGIGLCTLLVYNYFKSLNGGK